MPENDKIMLLLRDISSHSSQAAYKELFLMMHGRLNTFAVSILRSKYDAEEVVSDVFVKLWERRDRLHEIEAPVFYLFTAVKNTCINKLTQNKKEKHVSSEYWQVQLDSVFFDPERLMMTAEMIRQINQAINTLPPKCKLVFKLVKEEGLKYREAAELLQISVKTVEAQMAIALRRIGKCMHLDITATQEKIRS